MKKLKRNLNHKSTLKERTYRAGIFLSLACTFVWIFGFIINLILVDLIAAIPALLLSLFCIYQVIESIIKYRKAVNEAIRKEQEERNSERSKSKNI